MKDLTRSLLLATLARFARGLSLASIVAATLHTGHFATWLLGCSAVIFFALHIGLCLILGKDV